MLRITEIFASIQGESTTVGLPTVFVRLTGCPLRCVYCDTAYAFSGGERMEIETVVGRVVDFGLEHVTVTGGEPLAQNECLPLMTLLADAGLQVSLETSGAISVAAVDPRVRRVVDLKTPGSGESDKNLLENLQHLTAHDEIKFVVCDRNDYEWAAQMMSSPAFPGFCPVLMSPSHGQLAPQTLAEWLLSDGLAARLQLQIHKYLWGDEPGR